MRKYKSSPNRNFVCRHLGFEQVGLLKSVLQLMVEMNGREVTVVSSNFLVRVILNN